MPLSRESDGTKKGRYLSESTFPENPKGSDHYEEEKRREERTGEERRFDRAPGLGTDE